MGQGRWRTGRMAAWVGLVAGAAGLMVGGVIPTKAGIQTAPARADNSGQVALDNEAYPLVEPVNRATADMAIPGQRPGADARQAWRRPAVGVQRASLSLLHDNGGPLEDFGHPASQLSLCSDECADPGGTIPCNLLVGDVTCISSGMFRPEFFKLNAAAADDFVLEDFVSSNTNFQVSAIRAAFVFFSSGAAGAEPMLTWTGGIHVTVYANSVLDAPDGVPNGDGTFAGDVIATQLVQATGIKQILVGSCLPCWIVEMPVNIVLAKNTRYWLSLVPQHPGPPQSFWCLSQTNAGFSAHQGADIGPAFWTEILGNEDTSGCTDPSPPPAFTNKDLSFQIFGEELSSSFIACCDSSTGICRDVVAPMDCTPFESRQAGAICQFSGCRLVTGACCDDLGANCSDDIDMVACPPPALRFTPDTFCSNVSPPCGTIDIGACCFVDMPCAELNPTDCSNMGGTWNVGTCAGFPCPPANDDCDNAIFISTGTVQFDTRGATTDGPPDPIGAPCTDVNQDIWFRHVATCDGLMIVSLCLGTGYDAAVAVYDGCACGDALGPLLACDDDFCGSGAAAALATNVQQGNCYLIRVGGADNAVGAGNLSVRCIPDLTCCAGDANGDELLDDADVPVLIAALLDPPPMGTPAFCGADANVDGAVDGLDIQALVDLLTGGALCPPPVTGACCFSDESCVEDTVDGCFFAGGIYQEDGTICEADSCLSPVVNCCLGDLTGDEVLDMNDLAPMIAALVNPPVIGTDAFCAADVNVDGRIDGGDIQLFADRLIGGTSCTPPVVGACCLADGTCVQVTQMACLVADGIYQGDNSLCTPNLCPQPLLLECCLGDFNSDGIADILDIDGFVGATLNPPPPETPDACRADINVDTLVDGSDISGFVDLVLGQAPCPLPANDDCANARLLSCNTMIAVDNSQATTAAGDPDYSCRFGGPGQGTGTLWFSFVAIDTTALISTCNSFPPANDTTVAVYDVSCPTAGDEIACSEDAGGLCGRLSEVCVSGLSIGQTYHVEVSSFDASNQGFITLEIICPCP